MKKLAFPSLVFELKFFKKVLVLMFLVVGFLGWGGEARAATYTVCASGCDETTIQAVFDNNDLEPGDIVEVRADTAGGSKTYNEMVTWGTNDVGDSNNQVILQGRNGDTVTIDGEDSRAYCITQQSSGLSYITIDNLTVTGSTTRNIWLEGTTTASNGVTISNIISTGGVGGVWARNASNSNFSDITISGISGTTGFRVTNNGAVVAENVTLSDIEVDGGGTSSSGGIALSSIDGTNILGDLTVSNTSTGGIGVSLRSMLGVMTLSSGATITTNNSDYRGVYIDTYTGRLSFDGSIDINITNNNVGLFIGNSTLDVGSYINKIEVDNASSTGISINSASNLEIKQIVSINNGASGIDLSSSSSAVVLNSENGQSIISGNAWDGISINDTASVVIKGYIIRNNGGNDGIPVSEGDGITGHNTSTTVAINNIIYSNDNTCFAFVNDSNLTAYNNICYSNGTAGGPRGGNWTDNDSGSIILKNNILSENKRYEIYSVDVTALGTLTQDYNVFYHPADSNFSTTDNETIVQANLATWQTASSQDTNSKEGNPLFASSSDFHLTYLSLAIDSGTDVGLTTDYTGNPIYGTPDIGAYEYQPPYTTGTDEIDIGAGARIYEDGKFRDLATTSSTGVDLTIIPENDFESFTSTETRPHWLDITDLTWSATQKEWTESSDDSSLTNTLHTIGDSTSGAFYYIKIDDTLGTEIEGDDCIDSICQANSEGNLIFSYTGTYSTHTFEVTPREGELITELTDVDLEINRTNKTLQENKRSYLNRDNSRLQGEDSTIANGEVKIYKNGKKYATVQVDENGKWSKKISFGKNRNYEIKLKFYDQFDTLRDTKKYSVKVDKEGPVFNKINQQGDQLTYKATDEETEVTYYKVKLFDEQGKILRKWRKTKKEVYYIPEKVLDQVASFKIRAYDKAGNYTEEARNFEKTSFAKTEPLEEPTVQGMKTEKEEKKSKVEIEKTEDSPDQHYLEEKKRKWWDVRGWF